MVGYIRSDETPHVEYLRTALSELRACTLLRRRRQRAARRARWSTRCSTAPCACSPAAPAPAARGDARRHRRGASPAHRDAAGLQRRFDALDEPWTPPDREASPCCRAARTERTAHARHWPTCSFEPAAPRLPRWRASCASPRTVYASYKVPELISWTLGRQQRRSARSAPSARRCIGATRSASSTPRSSCAAC